MAKQPFDAIINSTAVTLPDEETPVSNLPALLGSDDIEFDADEISLPLLRVAQGLTKEVQDGTARPGQLVVRGHEGVDEVIFFPFRTERVRQYRPRENDGKLTCFSDDRITGQGEPGGACEACPLSQWTKAVDSKTGKEYNAPPPCREGWRYTGVSLTHGSMVKIEFMKKAAVIAKDVNTIIHNNGKRYGTFGIKIRAKTVDGPQGKYQVPVVSQVLATPEMVEAARERIL